MARWIREQSLALFLLLLFFATLVGQSFAGQHVLAVGTMVVFTIYLRQRGSPESKPVGAPHDETASTG